MRLGGVMVALATPIDESGDVDQPSVVKLVERTLAFGVTGVATSGTTGEGASLTLDQRCALVRVARQTARAEVPIVPGVFAESVAAALGEISAYAEAGAQAALVAPPHYYILGDEDVRIFFTELARSSALPLVLYQIPVYTKNPVAPAVVAQLAREPAIIGIKDSSRDMEYMLGVTDALRAEAVGPRSSW